MSKNFFRTCCIVSPTIVKSREEKGIEKSKTENFRCLSLLLILKCQRCEFASWRLVAYNGFSASYRKGPECF